MTNTSPRILVVDDEPDLRTLYEMTLLREGYDVETAGTVADALQCLQEHQYQCLISDMRLPDGSGLELLAWLEQSGRAEKTVVITAFGSAENAVEALKAGAYDYLTKPVDLKQFRAVIASALGRGVAKTVATFSGKLPAPAPSLPLADKVRVAAPLTDNAAEVLGQAQRPPTSTELARLAGQSAVMHQVRSLVQKVARSMAPVLINGESGTGKELVARAIHAESNRVELPFVAVNCGAIPEQLLEAEFFGYRKGSFTGAAEDRAGFFQAANGGTIFLDEIGDLPLAMQSKLLRAVQERAVRAIGAVQEVSVNVRVLSATHKDLGAEVSAGRFRQDLYYRLNVIQIRVPPLRERIEDLAAIADHLLARISGDAGVSPAPRLTASALGHLARYAFPGNVRELENLLHRALALSGNSEIDVLDLGLPEDALRDTQPGGLDASGKSSLPQKRIQLALADYAALPDDLVGYLDDIERQVLVRALDLHRYNRTAAGASLGLSLRQMRYRLARLGVSVGDLSGADGAESE